MADSPETMRSVQRVLAVFETFTPDRTSLTLQEIADCIDLPKSTTFRIIRSLQQAGYLIRLEDQRYCLSFRFTRLAGLVNSTLDIRTIARPVMMELADMTSESVAIHIAVGTNRVCIDSLEAASSPLRSVMRPGEQVPLASGSGSKTLMAYMPEEAVARILSAISRSTRRSQNELLAELARIRKQGYAVSHGERLPGLSAISAPIRDVDEQVHYCITVNGPSVRMLVKEQQIIECIVKAADDISRQRGGKASARDSSRDHARTVC